MNKRLIELNENLCWGTFTQKLTVLSSHNYPKPEFSVEKSPTTEVSGYRSYPVTTPSMKQKMSPPFKGSQYTTPQKVKI
ncbi:hypothetical protein [Photorhabdus akhurstii]|uniref:hypothetical protein n=1 Tax=Photorhabdus akhurstii TaxID=171438 RepID=UPI00068A9E50